MLAFSAGSRTTQRAEVRLEECDDEGSMVVRRAARGAAGRVGGGARVRFVRTGRQPVRFRRRHTRQERLLKQVAGHDRSCPFARLTPYGNQLKRIGAFIGRIDSNRVRSIHTTHEGIRHEPFAATLLRVALGVLYLAHVAQKVFVFTLPGTAQFFASIGLPGWLAYLTTFVELAGGLLLAGACASPRSCCCRSCSARLPRICRTAGASRHRTAAGNIRRSGRHARRTGAAGGGALRARRPGGRGFRGGNS